MLRNLLIDHLEIRDQTHCNFLHNKSEFLLLDTVGFHHISHAYQLTLNQISFSNTIFNIILRLDQEMDIQQNKAHVVRWSRYSKQDYYCTCTAVWKCSYYMIPDIALLNLNEVALCWQCKGHLLPCCYLTNICSANRVTLYYNFWKSTH